MVKNRGTLLFSKYPFLFSHSHTGIVNMLLETDEKVGEKSKVAVKGNRKKEKGRQRDGRRGGRIGN